MSHVTNISEGLNRLQVLQVVRKVEEVVILQSNIKGLDLFGGSAKAADSGVNIVFTCHKLVVLRVNLINDTFGVDTILEGLPVDRSVFLDVLLDVVEVEQRL